jgi:NHLM bacteriocin system ABC transporter ATP-binding protein
MLIEGKAHRDVHSDSAQEPYFARDFVIDDPEVAWIVEKGDLDLFLVSHDSDGLAGPRRHVLRARAGQAVFGLDVRGTQPNDKFLATGSPDVHVRKVPVRYLQEPQADGRPNATGTVLLENWIRALSYAAASNVPPKTYILAEPGQQIRAQQGNHILCNHDLVWVKHSSGASRFLSDPAIPLVEGEFYIPLTPLTWLETTGPSLLECIETRDFQALDPAWTGLAFFHFIFVSALNSRLAQEDEQQAARLRAKHLSDQKQIRMSLSWLASPVTGEPPRSFVRGYREPNSLLAACQIAGEAAGIEIRGPSSNAGAVSQDALRQIATASKIRIRRVLLRDFWWKDDHGPLVGYIQQGNRPIALVPGSKGYEIHDPSDGTTQRVDRANGSLLDPFAYALYRPFPDRKLTARDLIDFGLKHLKREVSTVVLTGVAAGILGLLVPIVTGMFFDTVIPGADREALVHLTILLVVAAFATAMFEMTRSLALLRLEGRMGAALQAAVWDRLLALPVSFFRQFSAGDLSDRANGIDGIRTFLTGTVSNTIISGIFSCFNLALMFYYSWKLSVVALGLLSIAVAATMLLGRRQLGVARRLTQVAGKLSGQVLQLISGVAKLRVSGAELRAFGVWSRRYSTQKKLLSSSRILSNRFSVFNSFFMVAGSMGIFYTVKEWAAPLSAGDFLAFNASFAQMFVSSMSMAGAVLQVMGLVPLFERATPILESAPEVTEAKIDPGELSGAIEVSHVSFRYEADKPLVLKDVSFRIPAGQLVALVGPSGCGKSTLLRLLLGFEDLETGVIQYDGMDLKGLDASSVRRQMGVVLQNSFPFRGDILSNIIGSKPLTIDDAWEAARLSGLDQDIKQMPMGMHTVITESGGISGGQRQRLMIARAIVSKPRILLFDEATSALDNQTQAIVTRSLDSLKATRVVIAHRLSTVMNADKIIVLDQGKVVQSGAYADLIQQEGLFAELAKRQLA